MDTPLITVIVPVYKVESYLRRCLDSIVGQTYQNLEIILVDDGSPDNCGVICDEYAAKDDRVHVLHTENQGAFAARNRALDIATGSFIAFIDADDWADRELLQALLELALKYNADIAQCELLNDGPYQQLRTQCLGQDKVYSREEVTRAFFREEIAHGLIGKLFRAACFAGQRFDEQYYHLDAVLLSGIRDYCHAFVRTDRTLYHYNTSNTSITRGKKNLKHIHSAEHLFEAFSVAADHADPEGSFFLCQEIPSAGRLILPQKNISLHAAFKHIHAMHRIFSRHWETAKQAPAYKSAPKAKKLLWHIYFCCPIAASVMVYIYAKISS